MFRLMIWRVRNLGRTQLGDSSVAHTASSGATQRYLVSSWAGLEGRKWLHTHLVS